MSHEPRRYTADHQTVAKRRALRPGFPHGSHTPNRGVDKVVTSLPPIWTPCFVRRFVFQHMNWTWPCRGAGPRLRLQQAPSVVDPRSVGTRFSHQFWPRSSCTSQRHRRHQSTRPLLHPALLHSRSLLLDTGHQGFSNCPPAWAHDGHRDRWSRSLSTPLYHNSTQDFRPTRLLHVRGRGQTRPTCPARACPRR